MTHPNTLLSPLVEPRLELLDAHALKLIDDLVLAPLGDPAEQFRAPQPGTGKSYLADLASEIATGERCAVVAFSPNPEETEKRLNGSALEGHPFVWTADPDQIIAAVRRGYQVLDSIH